MARKMPMATPGGIWSAFMMNLAMVGLLPISFHCTNHKNRTKATQLRAIHTSYILPEERGTVSMSQLRPTSITANRETSQLTIIWSDEHVSTYSFSLLRHACPCAECRGGHDKMSANPDPDIFLLPVEDFACYTPAKGGSCWGLRDDFRMGRWASLWHLQLDLFAEALSMSRMPGSIRLIFPKL